MPAKMSGSLQSPVVTHSEWLGTILSKDGTEPNIVTIELNPGLDASAPWLASVAANYAQYRYESYRLRFVSSIPLGQTTFESVGTLTIAYNPNPSDPPPTSSLELENFGTRVTGKPSSNLSLALPVASRPVGGMGLGIRLGPVPSGASINDYDSGKVFIATVGQPAPAGKVCGRLYADYRVRLMNPVSRGSAPTTCDASYVLTSCTSSAPLGASNTKVWDNIGLTVSSTSNGITFPTGSAGMWLVTFTWDGSTPVTYTPPTPGMSDNMIAGPQIFGGGATYVQTVPSGGASTAKCSYTTTVEVLDNLNVAALTLGAAGSLPTSTGQLTVSQLSMKTMK